MSDIAWRSFGEASFAEAQSENKPILLAIAAPWCQFCRNMDEQTYANDAIAQYIGDNFVPVRVDSDERPDVNSRYTVGGWPTTSVLTPEGDVLWVNGFVPPDGMAQILPQILNAFHNDKAGLAQRVQQVREQILQNTAMPPLDRMIQVTPDASQIALLSIKQGYDFAFAGFGKDRKFPHTDALEFCLALASRLPGDHPESGDLLLMILRTLAAIANGALHDQFAGGFFRYTERPDWQEPRYEKLLEDNALLLRTFARAYQLLGANLTEPDALKQVGEKALAWMDGTLYDAEKGVWYGSQAADDEYYQQPADERADWNPPAVDETILCGANAQAIRAHIAWWAATGDAEALAKAKRAGDYLLAHLRREPGIYVHFEGDDDAPVGLLADGADICAAFLDLYEAGQGVGFLDEAEAVATWAADNLEDPVTGGLYDYPTDADAPGNLKYGAKDLADNLQMADALLRLYLATGEESHAQLGTRILQAYLPILLQAGFGGVPVALVGERAMTIPAIVHVLGRADDPRTHALLAAAHRPYRYARLIQPLDPSIAEDAAHIANLDYPTPTQPVAYVSVGETVQEPTSDPDALTELVRTTTGTITLPDAMMA